MNIQKIENRLLYMPNNKQGTTLFDGTPYASMQVLDIIGKEGVEYIDHRLKTLLHQGIDRYGRINVAEYAFHSHQQFFDLQEQILLNVRGVLAQKHDYTINLIHTDNSSDMINQNKIKMYKIRNGIEDQIDYIKGGFYKK
jgi:hypothetical protein